MEFYLLFLAGVAALTIFRIIIGTLNKFDSTIDRLFEEKQYQELPEEEEIEGEQEFKRMVSCLYFNRDCLPVANRLKCAVNPSEPCLTCKEWRDIK